MSDCMNCSASCLTGKKLQASCLIQYCCSSSRSSWPVRLQQSQRRSHASLGGRRTTTNHRSPSDLWESRPAAQSNVSAWHQACLYAARCTATLSACTAAHASGAHIHQAGCLTVTACQCGLTSWTKSAGFFRSGGWKPTVLKYGRISCLGPWNTIRPAGRHCPVAVGVYHSSLRHSVADHMHLLSVSLALHAVVPCCNSVRHISTLICCPGPQRYSPSASSMMSSNSSQTCTAGCLSAALSNACGNAWTQPACQYHPACTYNLL